MTIRSPHGLGEMLPEPVSLPLNARKNSLRGRKRKYGEGLFRPEIPQNKASPAPRRFLVCCRRPFCVVSDWL